MRLALIFVFFFPLFIFDEAENYLQSTGTPNNIMGNKEIKIEHALTGGYSGVMNV